VSETRELKKRAGGNRESTASVLLASETPFSTAAHAHRRGRAIDATHRGPHRGGKQPRERHGRRPACREEVTQRCFGCGVLVAAPSELSASPSELLASPSELLASPSELVASPSEL
jgi:hypothetical protein